MFTSRRKSGSSFIKLSLMEERARSISLEIKPCTRNVRSRFRLHPRIAESEVSVLFEFTINSAKKLVVEPPVTVDLSSVLRPSLRLLRLCFFCHGALLRNPFFVHCMHCTCPTRLQSKIERTGSRTNVVLHKIAKVLWLKLRRDGTVLNTGVMIEVLTAQLIASEEIESEEERQIRLKKKKEEGTLVMDRTMEVLKADASSSSGARSSTAQNSQPCVQFAPMLPSSLWSDEASSAQSRRRRRPEARAARTSSPARVFATSAAAAELLYAGCFWQGGLA